MLNKNTAIKIILKNIDGPIISANGHISRNLYSVKDLNSNFYMIGSMGLASSIGLGVALKNKEKKVFVLDGGLKKWKLENRPLTKKKRT